MEDSNLQDLRRQTFNTVVTIVSILAFALLYIVLIVLRDDLFDFFAFWWLPSALVLLTCYICYKLLQRDRFRLSTYVFIAGLVIAANSFIYWRDTSFFLPPIYGLTLVVALAGVLIRPQAGMQVAAFSTVVTLVNVYIAEGQLSWPDIRSLSAPFAIIWAMAGISWISSDHLLTTVQWALDSQRRADLRSQELFESQQELTRAYQMLETTNIRLKEAEAAATQANELKTRFITNLSHELRTPLSAIINFSYILSQNHRGAVTKAQQDYLMRIHDSGELLLEIVNDLLDLAKIESGQMSLFVEPVDVTAIGESVMNTISGVIASKPIELCREIAEELPPVLGDETRIRQVLLNLLGNAAKYTDEGSITLKMADDGRGYVRISVIDTGIGIKRQDYESIFEEFRQTEEAFALRKQGTGLGLPITRKFVELHGGKLWVESEFGKGATFHFTLPVATKNIKDTARPVQQTVDFIDTKVTS